MTSQRTTAAGEYPTSFRRHGAGHSYKIDGVKVLGATTIISAGTPSKGLNKWMCDTVAGCAIDEWDALAAMPPSERMKYLAKAPDRARDEAGIRGTKVHKLAEPLSHGDQVEVPEPLTGYVEACVGFLDDWHAHPLFTETHVFSRKWMYGGSPDALFDVDRPDGAPPSVVPGLGEDRWRVLIDWKTKKSGPFGTDAYQLAAYRWAEFRLELGEGHFDGCPLCEGNGDQPHTAHEIPWAWAPSGDPGGNDLTGALPLADECWIVWLRSDSYQVVPMETNRRVHKQFLYIKMVAEAMDDCRDYRMAALTPPRRAAVTA